MYANCSSFSGPSMVVVSLSSVSYSAKLHPSSFFFSNSGNKSPMSFPSGVIMKPLETRRKSTSFVTQFQASHVLVSGIKGTAIEVAQILGKPNLAPAAWGRRLVTLCDQAPATPFHVVMEVLEKELGRRVAEVFERFDTNPLGSAQLVHRPRLTGYKNDVVVKAEDLSKLVNPFVFLGRLILGALAATYYVLVPIYMWIKDQIIPNGQPI